MQPNEPLTTFYERQQWVEDEAARTAKAHQSYIANIISVNTTDQMQKKENIAFADADGGGTIDKSEFAALLAQSGGGQTTSADAAVLFAAVDADGDHWWPPVHMSLTDLHSCCCSSSRAVRASACRSCSARFRPSGV